MGLLISGNGNQKNMLFCDAISSCFISSNTMFSDLATCHVVSGPLSREALLKRKVKITCL